jgi:shikimate kinase
VKRHVILVGLPGAGKTTVGKLAAATLAAPFVDLDEEIELASGIGIPRLFAERGEPAFRELEREVMERALGGPASVIAAGGGWAAQPGNLEAVAGRAVPVYLTVSPEVAARRAGLTAGNRPLLAGDAPARMQELFAERRGAYERCPAAVAADLDDPAAVAREVVKLARRLAGWY